ncbi:retrovirus-related pol polyprotein from transposon TNT 1-94 [Tanacetum coccineum]
MADLNIHVVQALAVAPPTRTDDQILPLSKAFTTSSTIPAIYIQQFWDTIDALNITPANDNNPFMAPPSSDTVIEYVNTLGYFGVSFIAPTLTTLKEFRKSLFNPYRHFSLIIHNLRTKHNIHRRTGSPLHNSHEESIMNTLRFVGKDGREIFGMPIPDALLTDEIKGAPYYGDYQEHVAKYQHFLDEEHGKAEKGGAIESSEATKVIKPKAAKATKPAGDKAPKPIATQPPIPKPAPSQPSKVVSEKKRKLVKETPDKPSPTKRSKGTLVMKKQKPKSPLKLVDEPSDEGVPVEEPAYNEEDLNLQRALELSLMEQGAQT